MDHRKTAVLSAAVMAVLGLAAPAAAQTALDPIAAQVRQEALILPADTPLVVLYPADPAHPRTAYTIHRTFAADGTFTTGWKGPAAESVQTFRPDGTLVSSRQTTRSGRNVLEETVDPGRTSVRTVVTVDGTRKSDNKVDLTPGTVLRDEIDHLIRQAWVFGVRDGLKFKSLSPDGGMAGDFQILFVPTPDPLSLSSQYQYPEEFKTVLGSRNGYLVADMSLQGIASLFYPYHFYMIYVPTGNGLSFTAYFGEDPKNPTFQYVAKN